MSIAPAAYFADQARIPSSKQRFKRFRPGAYTIYAPSRERRDTIIKWNFSVKKKLLKSNHVIMFSCWEDNGNHSWEYDGPVIVDNQHTIIRLNAVLRKSGEVIREGVKYRSTPVENDPAFIVIEKATETWSVRPIVITGYDSQGNCYSAIGIMREDESSFDDKSVKDLLNDERYYLDYVGIRRRITDMIHGHLKA